MNNSKFYFLKTIVDGEEDSAHALFLMKDNLLYRIGFEKSITGSSRHWHLQPSRRSWEISSEENMLRDYCSVINIEDFHLFHRFDPIELTAGKFYPRIFRPHLVVDNEISISPHAEIDRLTSKLNQVTNYLPTDFETALTGVTQLSLLIENLKIICRTVHPIESNLEVYGNEIRNQFILACTEVEAQLVGIYSANTTTRVCKPKTSDYVNLLPHLKLREYSVFFNLYPWLNHFRPFEFWNKDQSTQTLPWYRDYHAVKHNREQELTKASLRNLIKAISALAILLVAQYGENTSLWKDLIGNFFYFAQTPNWDKEECYLPPFKGSDWIESKALSS